MATNIRMAHSSDASTIAGIHLDGWQTAYKAIVPADYLAALSYEGYLLKWQQILTDPQTGSTQITLIAENAEQEIIGFISGGINRDTHYPYEAELYAVYLRQDIQQKGLGSHLVLALVQWLMERNYKTMIVWALEKNPAGKFYQALGGQLLPTHETVTFGNQELIEVAYGWESLQQLFELLNKKLNS